MESIGEWAREIVPDSAKTRQAQHLARIVEPDLLSQIKYPDERPTKVRTISRSNESDRPPVGPPACKRTRSDPAEVSPGDRYVIPDRVSWQEIASGDELRPKKDPYGDNRCHNGPWVQVLPPDVAELPFRARECVAETWLTFT